MQSDVETKACSFLPLTDTTMPCFGCTEEAVTGMVPSKTLEKYLCVLHDDRDHDKVHLFLLLQELDFGSYAWQVEFLPLGIRRATPAETHFI